MHYLESYPAVPGLTITDLGYPVPLTYTHQEIEDHIMGMSAWLSNNYVPGKTRIGILGEVSFNFISLVVAIARARMCFVPVNYKIPQSQIDFCFVDSEVDIIFCDKKFLSMAPANVKTVVFDSDLYKSMLLTKPLDTLPQWNGDYINYIMYTSGTTGNPKGVVVTYESRLHAISRGRDEPKVDRNLVDKCSVAGAPLYHLAGLNNIEQDFYYSSGATTHLVLLPVFDAEKYIKAVEKYKATDVRLVAPMMSMILQKESLVSELDLSSVNYVCLTSSAAPKKLQEDILLAFPKVGVIDNPYGTTETGPVFGKHPQGIPRPKTSVGYPLPGVTVKLDQHGVLLIKSDMLLKSYLNRGDLFEKSMTEDGYYITNDIFRVNKYGFYFYVGRADDMFKSGGEKIYPSEIESIIEQHPDVALSTVVGVEDDIKGFKPYAFVQLKPQAQSTVEQIQQYIIKNVASYQIPREVWSLEQLPKTNIGKIDRRQLTNLARELLNK